MCTLWKWESPHGNVMSLMKLESTHCGKRDWAESDHPHSQMAWFSEVNTKDPKLCPWLRTIQCNPFWALVGPSRNKSPTLLIMEAHMSGTFGVILHLFHIWNINWIWSLFLFLLKRKLLKYVFVTHISYFPRLPWLLFVSYYVQPVSQLLMSEVDLSQQTMNSLMLRSSL